MLLGKKGFIYVLLISLCIVSIALLAKKTVAATVMESGEYRIETQDLEEPEVTPTARAEAALDNDPFHQQGYLLIPSQSKSFRFTLSKTRLVFDDFADKNQQDRSVDFMVASDGLYNYQVSLYKESAFASANDNRIPDTECGLARCTLTIARPWTLNSVVGLGYTLSGTDIPLDFNQGKEYRPFADVPQIVTVVSYAQATGVRKSTLNTKLHVPPAQPGGSYQTVVHIIAMPKI